MTQRPLVRRVPAAAPVKVLAMAVLMLVAFLALAATPQQAQADVAEPCPDTLGARGKRECILVVNWLRSIGDVNLVAGSFGWSCIPPEGYCAERAITVIELQWADHPLFPVLSGEVSASLGELSELRILHIGNHPLRGNLPLSLAKLGKLEEFWFDRTCLTIPDDPTLNAWLSTLSLLGPRGLITNQLLPHPSCDFEIVDPQPDLVDSEGKVTRDAERLATEGDDRVGAAADGVTQVLLRYKLQAPGSVEYCLDNGQTPEDGGLTPMAGGNPALCVTVDSVQTTKGHFAFALYHVPEEFNRGGDEQLKERPITFKATVTSGTQPAGNAITNRFKLVRPPVVLIHGLGSDGGTWLNPETGKMFPICDDPQARWECTIADYRSSNAVHFRANLSVPRRSIFDAKRKYWAKGLAVTQVDVIGYSMGGILTRLHAASDWYREPLNFKKGDVNRLITLNTPHAGSPFGNLVMELRGEPYGPALEVAAARIGRPIDQGAIQDLAVGSAALRAMTATDLPSFAFVGVGGSETFADLQDVLAVLNLPDLSALPLPWQALLRSTPTRGVLELYLILDFFGELGDTVNTFFQGDGHDLVVGRISQEGGLPASSTLVDSTWQSIHTTVTNDQTPYTTVLITLLNTSPTSAIFSGLPAPSSVNVPHLTPVRTTAPAAPWQMHEGSLVITDPAPGATVQAGQTISVTVQADPQVQRVLVVGAAVAASDDGAPFALNVVIPSDALGALPISVLGVGDNAFFTSAPVTLTVATTATLTGITVLEPTLLISKPGGTRQIYVSGRFSDQISRDVTAASAGTTYATSNASIAAVSADGLVTFVGSGFATLTVDNAGHQATVNIWVFNGNLAPVADSGPDQSVAVGATVTLDARGSFDLDDAYAGLTFAWTQAAGPAVTLTDATTDHPSFVADQPGDYAFSLVVSDGVATSPAEVVVITATAAAETTQHLYVPFVLR